MEYKEVFVQGEASRQSLLNVHHHFGLIAPTIPQHLVASLQGYEGDYSQSANFPWSEMVCYMLEFEDDRVPATYIEHGLKIDFFGTGSRSNGYSGMGGVVTCSGGIFVSQQDSLSHFDDDDHPNRPRSYNESMESFNMYLAPIMNRENVKPSVGVIYSSYRRDFLLISSIEESWGVGPAGRSSWRLPSGWGFVGSKEPDSDTGWLNVIIEENFSEELTAAAQYLRYVDAANAAFKAES
jgi:hypothetical protein